MRLSQFLALTAACLLISGCMGSGHPSPVLAPDSAFPPTGSHSLSTERSNHHFLGLWRIHISDGLGSVEVIPLRTLEMHLNTVRMLEVSPCTSCLKLENFSALPDNVIQFDARIRHPIPYNIKWTGFDVRGIFISKADFTFPVSGRSMAAGDDVPRMLDPDGYTNLFNPTDFPPDSPTFPALKYFPGNYSPGGDLSSTLNPFVAYNKDYPRRHFPIESESVETMRIRFPHGMVDFGYAVDACWQNVTGGIIDPVTDFPPDANCLEAYEISVWAGPGLSLDPGAWTWVYATIYDHQGLETIATVTAEVPGVISGTVDLQFHQTLPDGAHIFKGKVTNELSAPTGVYPLLVRVVDTEQDQNLGQIDAWYVSSLPVRKGWVLTWGGEWSDQCETFAVDSTSSIYAWGSFQPGYPEKPIDCDPSPATSDYDSLGTGNWFLSKFDWGGGFEWVRLWKHFGNPTSRAIDLDIEDNVYVFSLFLESSKPFDFDPGPGVDERSAVGYDDLFLMKISPSGEFVWVLTWPEEDKLVPELVETAKSPCVYLGGDFTGTIDFDPGAGVDENTGSSDDYASIFLTKLGLDGSYVWTRTWISSYQIDISDIIEDDSGDVIACGRYYGVVDFDPGDGVDIHDSDNLDGTFLLKLDSDGNYQWGQTWTSADNGMYPDRSPYIGLDSDDNILIAHEFYNVVDFDPGPKLDLKTSNGCTDCFISKYSLDGEYLWTITWGGLDVDLVTLFTIDSDGYVWAGGRFNSTVDFDPGLGVNELTATDWYSYYLSKLDTNGNYFWTRIWDEGTSLYLGDSIACDSQGNAYLGFCFYNAFGFVDFDPGSKIENHLTNGYYSDAFLMKMPPDGEWW